jgi:hypothetical protein
MPILDAETWAEIRKAYEETSEPVTELAARCGIARSTVHVRAARESWGLRRPVGVRVVPLPRVARTPVANVHALAERITPREPDTAEARVRRMLGIIDLQLDQMESRMTSGQPMTTQDEERQARAFGAIAGNLEKITEAAADIFREAGHDGAANGHGDGRGLEAQRAEAERPRREIAERLERLNAQWLARGGAG